MNRKDLQKLSDLRMKEAKHLLRIGLGSGAYYLAGYSVELALKACIAKSVAKHDFPEKQRVIDSYTHDLVKLRKTAGIDADLSKDEKENPKLAASWEIVKNWSEQTRYEFKPVADARDLLASIEDRSNGVRPWLKKRW